MSEKLGQEPAFPQTGLPEREEVMLTDGLLKFGMSKRFYAACAVMTGLLSTIEFQKANAIMARKNDIQSDRLLIRTAYELADELLKQEAE